MQTTLTFQEKYKAITRKDPEYEGLFFTAVKSTGIFCRPTCSARKPKPENVVFYPSANDALLNGYRPCKVCKPMESAEATPDYIHDLIQELNANPYLRLKDYDLRQRGIEPSQLRRWFKKNHRMTFHAYQRMMRMNFAFRELETGSSVTSTAFDSGYESLSGFTDTYTSVFGTSPSRKVDKAIVKIKRLETPLGPMYACATEEGICLLEFTNRRMLETQFNSLRKRLDAVILPGTNAHLEQLEEELKEYFDGDRKHFEVALETPGTEFQQKAWQTLLEIPYGETVSYGEQARRLGKPNAVRAVATANGYNRIAIVLPCHRVIGEDGKLRGYGGGLARKQWLLDLERSNR